MIDFRQRLAAILAADAAGYSRLMSGDERAAVTSLDAAREAFRRHTVGSQGRIIDTAGDSVLALFETAAGSVSAALAIQKEVNALAAAVPDDRGMRFRIGIHLGDVIEKPDGTVYGDGVNIAARLQAMAEPGGIAVSDSIRSAVKGKLAADFDDQGERSFKNIADPVRVWWTRQVGAAAATAVTTHSTERTSAKASQPATGGSSVSSSAKPSIAVRPFTNMSGDPEQQYFSDGITEDIITDLSKISGLMVIARNTSFAPKYKDADSRTVGHELGVSSMLDGSIRRAGIRVRITAQLVDTATGAHLWAERFDRDVTDIFAIQDEVTRQIVDALAVTLRPGESARVASSHIPNVEAHDRFLFGHELLRASRELSPDVFNRVVEAFGKAIELDPNFPDPYAGLAMAYCMDFQNHLTDIPDALDVAAHFAAQAVDKGPGGPFAHFAAANVATWKRDLVRARVEADRALALNPNYAMAYTMRGSIEVYLGAPLAGIPYIQRGMLLDPAFAHQNQHFLGTAYLVAGRFQEAADSLRERVRLSPKTDLSRAFLASALGHLGEVEDARRVWGELSAINPRYSLTEHLARLPFQVDADRDRIREGVAKAGLNLMTQLRTEAPSLEAGD